MEVQKTLQEAPSPKLWGLGFIGFRGLYIYTIFKIDVYIYILGFRILGFLGFIGFRGLGGSGFGGCNPRPGKKSPRSSALISENPKYHKGS